MRADLVALGVRLGCAAVDDNEESALAAVMERLRHDGEGVLLIFDNAISAGELRPYLPPGGAARVLVTSNAHAWRGVAEPVEIHLWPKEIGADYLIARTGRYAEARRLFARLLSRCNDVGLLAEEVDPLTGRMLGNFPQAYSHVGLINCALNLSRRKSPAEERAECQGSPITIASTAE